MHARCASEVAGACVTVAGEVATEEKIDETMSVRLERLFGFRLCPLSLLSNVVFWQTMNAMTDELKKKESDKEAMDGRSAQLRIYLCSRCANRNGNALRANRPR